MQGRYCRLHPCLSGCIKQWGGQKKITKLLLDYDWAYSDVNTTSDGSTWPRRKLGWTASEKLYFVLRNAAGYHPVPVVTSATYGPLLEVMVELVLGTFFHHLFSLASTWSCFDQLFGWLIAFLGDWSAFNIPAKKSSWWGATAIAGIVFRCN